MLILRTISSGECFFRFAIANHVLALKGVKDTNISSHQIQAEFHEDHDRTLRFRPDSTLVRCWLYRRVHGDRLDCIYTA